VIRFGRGRERESIADGVFSLRASVRQSYPLRDFCFERGYRLKVIACQLFILLLALSFSALWDKKLSTISLPASLARGSRNNPNDEEVIESACYSRLAEPYMIRKYRNDEEYWSEYNVQVSRGVCVCVCACVCVISLFQTPICPRSRSVEPAFLRKYTEREISGVSPEIVVRFIQLESDIAGGVRIWHCW